MVTGGDLKIFLEKVFNNVDVEGKIILIVLTIY